MLIPFLHRKDTVLYISFWLQDFLTKEGIQVHSWIQLWWIQQSCHSLPLLWLTLNLKLYGKEKKKSDMSHDGGSLEW